MASTKGRTLFDILTGRNKENVPPLELQYHNPLAAKVGMTVSFDHEPDIRDINFVIEKMSVYETLIDTKKFHHTDYHLKGVSIDADRPLRFRLRLIPDPDSNDKIGCRIQLLQVVDTLEWDENLYNAVNNDQGEFQVNEDDFGNTLPEPKLYWRVEDVIDPYHANITILKDDDGDGVVEMSELERLSMTYWDFHRDTKNEHQQTIREYLTVEMNDKTRFFTFLRGTDVEAFQVTVI